MSKLDRWSSNEIANSRFANGTHFDNREWCRSEDVERLESDYAKLEASHAELLEALKEIVDQTDGRNSSHIGQDRAHSIARAAIAKAEGKQA